MSSELYAWIADSRLSDWVNSAAYIWPTLESIHFVSLCVLFGSLLIIDLRLIGFFRDACAATVGHLSGLAIAAFSVNLVTGLLFFAGNTSKYVGNPAFEIKLILITAAGVNALFYRLFLRRLAATQDVSTSSVCVGAVSLGLWAGVIVCGRMITFYAP
ncbi:MAG TPA: hypothetical protein VKQ06_04850 [Gammaproteobacteria bacterium]|nr:hypothetical protein [Gammaproteobacteria bacterium]